MICALKEIGGPAIVYDVPDPVALFVERCGDNAKVTHISGQRDGLAALTHLTPDLADGINMQVGGTIFYGTLVFICSNADDKVMSLSRESINQLSSCTKVIEAGEEM